MGSPDEAEAREPDAGATARAAGTAADDELAAEVDDSGPDEDPPERSGEWYSP